MCKCVVVHGGVESALSNSGEGFADESCGTFVLGLKTDHMLGKLNRSEWVVGFHSFAGLGHEETYTAEQIGHALGLFNGRIAV